MKKRLNNVLKIQDIIDSITEEEKNRTCDVFLNNVQNELITIRDTLDIPKIPVKELDYDIALNIMGRVRDFIPEFLWDHVFIKDRNPASDQHFLHFIKKIRGRIIHFTHIYKIDLKFGGDSSNIIERGNSDYYPSFITNRFYFKSRLVPEEPSSAERHHFEFLPLKLKESINVEASGDFYTFALFDDPNSREITKKIIENFEDSIFTVSIGLYPFIVYDYFTICFNVLQPRPGELQRAIEIFEPLFIYLYSRYRDLSNIAPVDVLKSEFAAELDFTDNGIRLKENTVARSREYFSRFRLETDYELLLKGWRRFVNA